MYKIFILLFFIALSACATKPIEQHSHHAQLYSQAMQKAMHYSVYTPPGWNKSESLPLLVLLHGARDDHRTFDRYHVGQYLDKLIAKGDLPRMIILNPEGELGFWENWYDGSRNYRDWVIQDLLPVVQRDYATKACPDACYVSGISMGAHGAMRFAYYHPEIFASVALISGPIFTKQNPDHKPMANPLLRLLIPVKRIWGDVDSDDSPQPKDIDPYISFVSTPLVKDIPLFIAWGDQDSRNIRATSKAFHDYLVQQERPHTWLEYTGRHKWVDWRAVIAESMRFHLNWKQE